MSFAELPISSRAPVSSMSFSVPADDTLLVASYNGQVELHNYKTRSSIARFQAPSPALSMAHSPYRATFLGLLDGTIRHMDFENMSVSDPVVSVGEISEVSTSTSQGVNCFRPLDKTTFVATSFGGNLLLFDPRTSRCPHEQRLKGKIFAMDTCSHLITVAEAQSVVEIFDARKMAAAVQTRESGLRFQVTGLRNFNSGEGYALSSVDGRVSVEYFDTSAEAQAQKFAFKCHRTKDHAAAEDLVYPVTGLQFHPKHGTLFTAGGDGNVCIWNWAKRKRMKLLGHEHESPRAISHMDISSDGAYLAVSLDDDSFSRAGETGQMTVQGGKILLRELSDADCKPKS